MINLTAHENMDLLDRYQSIPISYLLRYSILKRIERGEEVLEEIQGREQVKEDVMRALLSGAQPYLVSEEGTGKTRLARSISKLLLPVPKIKGCPYNDDPKWPKARLCPRCRESANPVAEFGIEWISGQERFSRIQGNEYTNEAKLLGLKDIQAIARGMSPKDPLAFAGTGVFRANRGVLFIDELPAIRTKVQVLLHPIIEEKKAILEEYNWEYPLDLLVVSTGNPGRLLSRERGAEAAPRQAGDRLHGPARRGRGVHHHDDGAVRGAGRVGAQGGASRRVPHHGRREAAGARAVVDTLPHQQIGEAEQDMPLARQEGEHQGHDEGHRPYLFVDGDGESAG